MLHYFYLRKTHIKHLFPPLKSQKKKSPFSHEIDFTVTRAFNKKSFPPFPFGLKTYSFFS